MIDYSRGMITGKDDGRVSIGWLGPKQGPAVARGHAARATASLEHSNGQAVALPSSSRSATDALGWRWRGTMGPLWRMGMGKLVERGCVH